MLSFHRLLGSFLLAGASAVAGCSAEQQGGPSPATSSEDSVGKSIDLTPPPVPADLAGGEATNVGVEHFVQSFQAMNAIGLQYGAGGSTGVSTNGKPAIIYSMRVFSSPTFLNGVIFAWCVPTAADSHCAPTDLTGSTQLGGTGGTDHGWDTCPTGTGYGTGLAAYASNQPGLIPPNPSGEVTGIQLICNNKAGTNKQFTPFRGSTSAYFVYDECTPASQWAMTKVDGTTTIGQYDLNSLLPYCSKY